MRPRAVAGTVSPMPDERRFLEMDDGVRIALTLHFPDTPPPWPVVFEARPYRKDDLSDATSIYRRLCDEGGLAVCRADVRGTGSSEGNAVDEYTARELEDHVATIAWLAAQDWSNGNVGMYGTSYSGFNALQVAALRPPALKAIIPIYATDRRYTDDVHYGGGARRGIDFLDYPAYMVALIALPPVPSVYGDGWREEWHPPDRGERAVGARMARASERGRLLAPRLRLLRLRARSRPPRS